MVSQQVSHATKLWRESVACNIFADDVERWSRYDAGIIFEREMINDAGG